MNWQLPPGERIPMGSKQHPLIEAADAVAAMYMDGTLALEIEHLLVMRLNDFNTIKEIELLKQEILSLMQEMYSVGQERKNESK